MREKNKKPLRRKIVLRLPDLDHSKNAVLNSQSDISSSTVRTQLDHRPAWLGKERRCKSGLESGSHFGRCWCGWQTVGSVSVKTRFTVSRTGETGVPWCHS